jgi:hypothetical protein
MMSRNPKLVHNIFLGYIVNPYMFRAYLIPSSEVQPFVYNICYLLFFLDDCLLSWLDCPIRPGQQILNGIKIIYNQSPSCSAHSSTHLASWLYRSITYLFAYVQFGFRTFITEQDSLGCAVTGIRAWNREAVFGFQAEVKQTALLPTE